MRILMIYIIVVLSLLAGACDNQSNVTKMHNPFEGTTWEMVSAKYVWGDTTFVRPTSPTHHGLAIYGKTRTIAVWQDPEVKDVFYVGHKYSVKGDQITFTIQFWPDTRFIGHSFHLGYELQDDKLTVSGIIPRTQWGVAEHDMDVYEVWKRLD